MLSKLKFNFFTFRNGLLMGMADAVPGVSGGTIALILGIYDKLIFSISECLIFFKDKFPRDSYNNFISSFKFLFTLGLGMLTSYYFITKILVGSDDNPGLLLSSSSAPYIFSLFFGLVISSIREPWSFVKSRSQFQYLLCIVGICIVVVYTRLSLGNNGDNLILVISGCLALTAMLLPGISGSLVLLTLGQYTIVAGSIHDLDFQILFYFLFGGLIGLFFFIPFMNYMLNAHKENIMSVLTGLMIGSLSTLWPWKENYEAKGISPNLGIDQILEEYTILSIVSTISFAFLGFCFYLVLNRLKKD